MLTERINELEAMIAYITNNISQTIPSDDELESVRVEVFSKIAEQRSNIEELKNIINSIEQRIT